MKFKTLEYISKDMLVSYLSDKLFWQRQREESANRADAADIYHNDIKSRIEMLEEILEDMDSE